MLGSKRIGLFLLALSICTVILPSDANAGTSLHEPGRCPQRPTLIYFSHQWRHWWGHHFVCIFHVFEDGSIQAGVAGHGDENDLQYCQSLISSGGINPTDGNLVEVSFEVYMRFVEAYRPTTSNDPSISWCELGGACVVPFTLGYTKPCRMEARKVMSMIESFDID
jgi:hypothetical protein